MSIFWKIKRKIRKFLIAHSTDPRPPSFPFISGDSFRSIADHVYESGRDNPNRNSRSFDPRLVKEEDVVFVESDSIDKYFADLHTRIQNPYKLITHNGDRNITEKEIQFMDKKIIRWFAQNVLVNHPKLTPIPIGLENAYYANAGYLPFYTKSSHRKKSRQAKILGGFNVTSNIAERSKALETLSSNINSRIITERLDQPDYVSTIKKYCFVASPPGNGEECHRTWEAMILGTVPIVKHSVCIEYFEKINLPLWQISSWKELENLSAHDLITKYKLIKSKANTKALYMNYWQDLIKST